MIKQKEMCVKEDLGTQNAKLERAGRLNFDFLSVKKRRTGKCREAEMNQFSGCKQPSQALAPDPGNASGAKLNSLFQGYARKGVIPQTIVIFIEVFLKFWRAVSLCHILCPRFVLIILPDHQLQH